MKRSSIRAPARSLSRIFSTYSTPKIAFESAWAGPSWTSCARRVRSASRASTIRIWKSSARSGAAGSARRSVTALEEQPRPLEAAHRELEAGELRLALAELRRPHGDPAAQVRGEVVGRAVAVAPLAVDRRQAVAVRPVEGVAFVVPAAQRRVERLAVLLGDGAQGVGGARQRLLRLGVEGIEPFRRGPAGVDLRAHLRASIRAAHGQTTRKARISLAPAGAPGPGGGRAISSRQPASGSVARRSGQPPCSPSRSTTSAPKVAARSTTLATGSSGRESAGARSTSASQIGWFAMTGAEPSRSMPAAASRPRKAV